MDFAEGRRGEVRRRRLPHTQVHRDRHGIVGPRPDRENGRMTVLRIDDLLANAPVDPEAHLDAARVERYAGMVDALPPVVVFETPDGLLLADGYHRVAAWRRSRRRCELARGTMRCDTWRWWAPRSAGSRPRRPPRISRDTLGTDEPRCTE